MFDQIGYVLLHVLCACISLQTVALLRAGLTICKLWAWVKNWYVSLDADPYVYRTISSVWNRCGPRCLPRSHIIIMAYTDTYRILYIYIVNMLASIPTLRTALRRVQHITPGLSSPNWRCLQVCIHCDILWHTSTAPSCISDIDCVWWCLNV